MNVETTITIEADLLARADVAAKSFQNRSEVFEKALRVYLPTLNQKPQKQRLTRDEEIKALNRFCAEKREEILENLEIQADLRNAAKSTESKDLQNKTQKDSARI